MRKLLLLAVPLSVILAGCSSPIAGTAPKLICESWHPVTISKNDKLTDQTAREIAGNNAANVEFCGERKPQRVASKS
jgi:hypothetical protein